MSEGPFSFNQSACWFSWLWALYKQNQMAAPGTGWGTETLGREMREETYREGVWEIKVFIKLAKHSKTQRWSATPMQDRRRQKTAQNWTWPWQWLNTMQDLKEQAEQTGREVFHYPEWITQVRQVPHCLFELVHMVNNTGVTDLWITCLES